MPTSWTVQSVAVMNALIKAVYTDDAVFGGREALAHRTAQNGEGLKALPVLPIESILFNDIFR